MIRLLYDFFFPICVRQNGGFKKIRSVISTVLIEGCTDGASFQSFNFLSSFSIIFKDDLSTVYSPFILVFV